MKSEYIKYRERRKQIIDFTGLTIGTKFPTDIDCMCEWSNKGYVMIEVKHRGANIPQGQFICLTRMADDFEKLGKKALVILAEHFVDDCEEDVDVAKCIVRWFYRDGQLFRYDGTVKDLYIEFIEGLENAR